MRVTAWLRDVARSVFFRRQVGRDLDDELNCFVDELAARVEASGASREEARRRVLLDVGGIDALRASIRRERFAPARQSAAVLGLMLASFMAGAGAAAAFGPEAPAAETPGPAQRAGQVFVSGRSGPLVLSGIVRDRETGRPLPNVRITLQERPKSVTTRTDEDGRFRVTETSTFGYDLSLGRTGWDFSLRKNLFSAVMASAGDPFRILEVEMPAEAPFQVAWRRVPGSDAMGPYRIRVAANGTVTEREVEIFDPETSLLEIEAPDVPALTYGRYFR